MVPFTAEVFQETFHVKELSSLVFLEEKVEQKIVQKTAKKLTLKKVRQTNDWSLAMYREERKRGPFNDLVIRFMNPLVGYGVYTLSTIPSDTYIGEYLGVVRKRKWRADRSNDYIFGYVIGSYDTPFVIDAKEQGNFTRFVNHSFTPNLTSKWMIIDGISHIIFFSNRKIEPGEQLTYDYGPYFWKKRSFPITI